MRNANSNSHQRGKIIAGATGPLAVGKRPGNAGPLYGEAAARNIAGSTQAAARVSAGASYPIYIEKSGDGERNHCAKGSTRLRTERISSALRVRHNLAQGCLLGTSREEQHALQHEPSPVLRLQSHAERQVSRTELEKPLRGAKAT